VFKPTPEPATSTIPTRGDETCGKFDSTAYIQTASRIHPDHISTIGMGAGTDQIEWLQLRWPRSRGPNPEIFLLHRVSPDRFRNPLSLLSNVLRVSFTHVQSGSEATLRTHSMPKLRIDRAKFSPAMCLHDVLRKQTQVKFYLSEKQT
jgi:hypothetical protein